MSHFNIDVVTVAAVKGKAAVTTGKFGGVKLEMMLDSGSSVSLVQQSVLPQARGIVQAKATQPLRLVTASGDDLPSLNHIRAPIEIGELKFMHDFVVVGSLVAPLILGVDFLHGNGWSYRLHRHASHYTTCK